MQTARSTDFPPAEWTAVRLGNLAKGLLSGGTPPTKNRSYWIGKVPWITSKWLNDRLYLSSGEKMISEEAVEASSTKVVPAGNLVFATRVGVGKVAVNLLDVAINQDLAGILLDTGLIRPDFAAYQLRTNRVKRIVELNKRGATIKGITRGCLEEIELLVPPLAEQRKIATVLSTVQRAIEQQERLAALTTELKKALMHKLFTEGTRNEPQKETDIGPIPESWEVQELKDCVEYIDYGISKAIPKSPPENGVRIVSTADITRDGDLLYEKIRTIDAPEKTIDRLRLRNGDVLFNWRNSLELIGKTSIFEVQAQQHIFASFILRLRCDEKRLHNYFLKYLMNHWRERGVFVKLARRAVNQANYNKNELSVLKIPMPSYAEQVRIADMVGSVDRRIAAISIMRDTYRELFRTLLHQLMTAQIRVNDIDVEEIICR